MHQDNSQKLTQLQDWLGKDVTVHFTGRIDSSGQEQFASEKLGKVHTLEDNYVVLCFHHQSDYYQEFGVAPCEKRSGEGKGKGILEAQELGHLLVPLKDITLEPINRGEGMKVALDRATWDRTAEELKSLCEEKPLGIVMHDLLNCLMGTRVRAEVLAEEIEEVDPTAAEELRNFSQELKTVWERSYPRLPNNGDLGRIRKQMKGGYPS